MSKASPTSWSYTGDPASSPRDALRFIVGDIDEDRQQISDEEIDYVLTIYPVTGSGANYAAAAVVAEAIAARYSALSDKSVGGLSISYGSQRDAYTSLAQRLRAGASKRVGPPELGGGGDTYLGNDFK